MTMMRAIFSPLISVTLCGFVCANSQSKAEIERGVEVAHVNVVLRSSADAAIAALASLRGKSIISDRALVTVEKRPDGYLVEVCELTDIPHGNPVDPKRLGKMLARVVVGSNDLVIEMAVPRSSKGVVPEDQILAGLTFLGATGRAPRGSWILESRETLAGISILISELPFTPGAHSLVIVMADRIIVKPGA